MIKRIFVLPVTILYAIVLEASSFLPSQNVPPSADNGLVRIEAGDRILIFAPHPDDEILGCAGIIQKARVLKVPVRIVFLTFGDSNEWSFLLYRKHPVVMPKAVEGMGEIRHDEAVKAAGVLDIPPEDLIFLGYPDFGTQAIWRSHWAQNAPYESILTKVNAVPYSNAFRPGALYKGEEILADLEKILREFKPTKIFVTHAADHNGDHQAAYLFTRVALWDLKEEISAQIYPFLIHFKNWPKPRGYRPGEFLRPPGPITAEIQWRNSFLTEKELQKKELALREHRTQYDSSAVYLNSFIKENEMFGDFLVIKLGDGHKVVNISPGAQAYIKDVPEYLTDEEKFSFSAFEQRYIGVEDGELVFTIKLSRPLVEATGLSLFAFGYRLDRPFGEMPKLHIKVGLLRHEIFDQGKIINASSITIERRGRSIKLQIPFELLGNPDHVLTSAQLQLGDVPLDLGAWRVLEL